MRHVLCFLTLAISIGCVEEQVEIVGENTATTEAGSHNTPSTALEVTEVAFNEAGAPTVEISVPGMMCPDGCAPKVHEALSAQPGVLDVKVVYDTKTAFVAFREGAFDADAAVTELEDEYGFADSALKTTDSAGEVAKPMNTDAEATTNG